MEIKSVADLREAFKDWYWLEIENLGDKGPSQVAGLRAPYSKIPVHLLPFGFLEDEKGIDLNTWKIEEPEEIEAYWDNRDGKLLRRTKAMSTNPEETRDRILLGLIQASEKAQEDYFLEKGWSVTITLPAVWGATAPYEILCNMQEGWATGAWRKLSGRSQEVSERANELGEIAIRSISVSTKYRFGEQVSRNSTQRQRTWFVTSYRSPGGMGNFRLYREDGKFVTVGGKALIKVPSENDETTEERDRLISKVIKSGARKFTEQRLLINPHFGGNQFRAQHGIIPGAPFYNASMMDLIDATEDLGITLGLTNRQSESEDDTEG